MKPSTPAAVRMLRSVMYVPGINTRAMEKSLSMTSCDAFIVDLEDAVAPASKLAARAEALKFIASPKRVEASKTTASGIRGRRWALRVNGEGTEWNREDLEAAIKCAPDAIVLPKVESAVFPDYVRDLLKGTSTEIWSMIETPRGVLECDTIAKASDLLLMGTVDLANELRCSTDPALQRAPLQHALQHALTCARAHRIDALDGVYVHLDDEEGFKRECAQGVALGFDGKSLVHPKTVDAANQAFSPSRQALERAQRIVEAHGNSKGGAILLDGKLVEELHVRGAMRLLQVGKAIEALATAAESKR